MVWRAKGVADVTEAQGKALEELFDFCQFYEFQFEPIA